MKRDMELVRKILLELEKLPDYGSKRKGFFEKLIGEPDTIVWYHLDFMNDAGLIVHQSRDFVRLTWQAYEFLETIRDDKRWEKVKAEMAKGRGFVFDVAKEIALDFYEEEINPNTIKSLRTQLIRRYSPPDS